MNKIPSRRTRSARRLLPALGLVVFAWACGKSVVQDVGDALVDAGDALRDAGGTLTDASSDSAAAQTPTAIPVTCTQSAENVTSNSTLTQRMTMSYEWVTVADPRKVVVERCGWAESVSCPTGSTCTNGIPVPGCRLSLPQFQNDQVFVECGRTSVVTTSTGVVTAESSQSSSSVRLLISP